MLTPYKQENIRALSSGDLAVMLNSFLHGTIMQSLHCEPDTDLTQQVDRVVAWMRASLYNVQHVDEILARLARGERLPTTANTLEAAVRSMIGVLWVYGDKQAATDAITWSADHLHELFKSKDN